MYIDRKTNFFLTLNTKDLKSIFQVQNMAYKGIYYKIYINIQVLPVLEHMMFLFL